MPDLMIDDNHQNQRIDAVLASLLDGLSRSMIQRMIDTGHVTVNGERVKSSFKVKTGDMIDYDIPAPKRPAAVPEDISVEIIYEDDDLIVINKPRGMASHPAPGTPSGTVVNAILAHTDKLSSAGGNGRPGIVHRLDKYTSGLMMIAKNDAAHHVLQAEIQSRTAKRKYLALVWGNPKFDTAEVDAPIGRNPVDRKRMAVITSVEYFSRNAVTEFHVIKRFGAFALMEASLQTGRTHQVRVHSAYAGHPVVGDPLYSGDRRLPNDGSRFNRDVNALIDQLNGQALHAYRLSLNHPVSGNLMEFTAEMPAEMKALIEYIEMESGK